MNSIIKIVEFDKYISEHLAKITLNEIATKLKIEKICLFLEWIMHGVSWLIDKLFKN